MIHNSHCDNYTEKLQPTDAEYSSQILVPFYSGTIRRPYSMPTRFMPITETAYEKLDLTEKYSF